MGCGSWDTKSFVSYSTARGFATDSLGIVTGSYSNQEMFKAKNIDAALDPKGLLENVVIMKSIRILYRLFWL